jgi:hypothetical protein
MSAVAAVAVASPFAVLALSELSASPEPAPQQREFVQAGLVSDLSGQLMSALSQGLRQFGIDFPPLPNLMGSTGAQPPSFGPMPALGLGGATSNPLGLGGATSDPLGTLGATSDPLGTLGATSNPLGTLGATSDPLIPGLSSGSLPTASLPSLTGDALSDMTLTAPVTPGIQLPPADPSNLGLTAPGAAPFIPPALGLSEQPIGPQSYPLMGGPMSLPMSTSTDSGGGLMSGVSDAINLVNGLVMPLIMSGVQAASAGAGAAPA